MPANVFNFYSLHLAHMLDLLGRNVPVPDLGLEHPPEQLEQDLEADLANLGIVAALAQLVADEGMLRPGELVEAGDEAGLAHLGADKVAAFVGDVGVLDAEDHGKLGGGEVGEAVDGVIGGGEGLRGGVAGLVGA